MDSGKESNIQTQYVRQGLTQDGQRNDCISHLEQRSIFQKAQLALNLGGDLSAGENKNKITQCLLNSVNAFAL